MNDCVEVKKVSEYIHEWISKQPVVKEESLTDNYFGLDHAALSRRDSTLLTVCFSLRVRQVHTLVSPAGTTLNTIKR
jgi:hypothetical protein